MEGRPLHRGRPAEADDRRRSSTAKRVSSCSSDVSAYVDGINTYIQRRSSLRTSPRCPGEYAALGKMPQPWDVTDVIAEASLIGGIFGRGGGREVASAQTLQEIQRKLGRKAGARSWLDFREANDPRRRPP